MAPSSSPSDSRTDPEPRRRRAGIRLVLATNVTVFVGVTGARIVYSLYGLQLGAGAAGVGAIMAMLYVFPLLLSWPIGALADRHGARGLLVGGTACGAAAMLVPVFWPALAALYVSALFLGFTLAATSVLGQFLIGELSRPDDRAKNFGNYALSGAVCLFLGPVLAGFCIDHFGHIVTCGVIALLLLGVLGMLLAFGGLFPRGGGSLRERGNVWQTLRGPGVWKILAISSLAQLANDLFQTFVPVLGHEAGLSAAVIGSVLSAFAAGSFAVRIAMARLVAHWGEGRVLVAAFHCSALTYVLLPFAHGPLTLGALGFLFGCALGCAQPLTMLLMFGGTSGGRAGQLVGLRLTANNVARILGPALFGAIAAAASLLLVFWINAGLMALGGRLGGAFGRRQDT